MSDDGHVRNRRPYDNVLETVGWRIEGVAGAAQVLGLRPSTLRTRMRKLGIQRPPKAQVVST